MILRSPGDGYWKMRAPAIDAVTPGHPAYQHWLMGYNNDPSRSFGDIQQVLRLTEQRAADRLKAQ